MRIKLNISDEIDQRLTDLARVRGISKGEVMKRAFALLSIEDRFADVGAEIAILRDNEATQHPVIVCKISKSARNPSR